MTDSAKPILQLNELSVDYITDNGSARAVNKVTLDIRAGETVGLAGESGCGKSTLAFAIANLHAAPALISEGEILFEGRDILKMSDRELRAFRWSDASMVFQSAMNALNPVITIGDQIIDVILAHKNMARDAAWARGEELLEIVGIHPSRMSSYAHQLSGGMRQRVVIAIALALRPKLIIMDEPTTALDVVVEREIMEELYALKEEYGFAILFISHDLSLMGEIADRIAVMYAGHVVELGAASKILNDAEHPYTKGLVASFPTIHGPKVRLEGIPGSPPNLLELGNGCPFVDRCSQKVAQCEMTNPMLITRGDKLLACHVVNAEEKTA